MNSATICFMCGQNSVELHLASDDSRLSISNIISQHFWFEEDVLQTAFICESCWQKVDQFHRFYQEVRQHHDQLMQPDAVFIKQEEIELVDEVEGRIQEFCTEDVVLEEVGNPFEEKSEVENECKKQPVTTNSKSKPISSRETKQREEDDFIKQHRPFLCDDCPVKFESFAMILRHTVDIHGKPYIKCCNVRYRNRTLLFQHVQLVINPDAFKCEICGKSYMLHSTYVRHKQEVHLNEDQLVLKCDRCPKLFSKQDLLRRHIAKHETLEKEEAKCEICGKCFGTQISLRDHIQAIHEKKANYICEICSKPFTKRQVFLDHRITHDLTADQLKRQCPICKKWQKNPKIWKKHITRHKSEGAFKCDQCDHVSINLVALKCHIERQHKKMRKFVCDLCGKEYSRPVTLKEHVANAHTGQPLYQCTFCDKNFFSNASMYSHRKKVHPQELEEYNRTKYSMAEKSGESGDGML
ncbi:transcription factor grauzone [Aedes aegypti]|uniref:C2H2-type domain-containing protein n=1 Tax=Aedes aegypti TaxID=7159 RepID=A0A6I8U9E5_AEDAE|nr:transcription factor grauzone [Aedes aegypti]